MQEILARNSHNFLHLFLCIIEKKCEEKDTPIDNMEDEINEGTEDNIDLSENSDTVD